MQTEKRRRQEQNEEARSVFEEEQSQQPRNLVRALTLEPRKEAFLTPAPAPMFLALSTGP
jgi:hypothetical protein